VLVRPPAAPVAEPLMVVPVSIDSAEGRSNDAIRIDIRRSGMAVQLAWPATRAVELSGLLKYLLKGSAPTISGWWSTRWTCAAGWRVCRVQNRLGRSPCDGSAYAFRNRRGSRLKLLIWDGTGVWLCHRRLHQGHFVWPTAQMTTVTLTARRWDWLVTGVEWQRLDAPTSPASRWNGWTLTMTQQLA
jgi:transposase